MDQNKLRHAVAVFVKTPGLSPIKTRLANGVGPAKAAEFYKLSLDAVKEVVSNSKLLSQSQITPFWAVAENSGLAGLYWQDFEVIYQNGDSLGERLNDIYSRLKKHFDLVTFIGSDAPQITAETLEQPVVKMTGPTHFNKKQVVIGPAYDGGFYLFSSNSEIPRETWLKPTYSSSDTLCNLLSGLPVDIEGISHLPQLTDVDTIEDLLVLRTELEQSQELLASQDNLLRWLSTETIRNSNE